MKQELIKRLNACCMLTFPLMMAWIDALIFPNDNGNVFKAWLKTQIKPNGELPNSAWLLLLQNAEFEANSPITSAVAVGWLQERTCPTCEQFKVIINALKISPSFPLYVEAPVLDLVELDFKLYPITDLSKNKAYMIPIAWINGLIEGHQIFVHVPEFHIRNFDLIKDFNPYLIVERLMPTNRPKRKKSGWRRDRTMMKLGGTYNDNYNGNQPLITEENGYRPNEIPLNSAIQMTDLFIENYFVLPSSTSTLKRIGFGKYDSRNFQPFIANNSGQVVKGTIKTRIRLRFRIGFKIGNTEKISKPLKEISIFAQQGTRRQLTNDGQGEEPAIVFSIGK